MLFKQHLNSPYKEVESFDKVRRWEGMSVVTSVSLHAQAVDEFFSSKSSQKQDLKALSVVR